MGNNKPKAPVHSAEHILREQSVVPVWLPQINEQWKDGRYEQSVRLPRMDLRQPLAKPEAAINGKQEQRSGPSSVSNTTVINSFTSSSKTNPQPRTRVKLPSTGREPTPIHKFLVAVPTKTHFPRSTRGRDGQLRLRPRNHEPTVTRISKSQFSRCTRGRGDSRNAAMRQAKLRYEQEKLALQQDQQILSESLNVYPGSLGHGFGGVRCVAGMTNVHRPTFNLDEQYRPAQQRNRPANAHRRFQSSENPTTVYEAHYSAVQNDNIHTRPHPSTHRPNGSFSYQQQPSNSVVRRPDSWSTWLELRVKVFGLPMTVTTLDLWNAFSQEGPIDAIEIFEDSKGARDGKASVRYRPPPARPFWQIENYPIKLNGGKTIRVRLELEQQRRSFLVPSPVRPQVQLPEVMTMNADSLDFGFMFDSDTMMCMHNVKSVPSSSIQFRQNMFRREIGIEMQIFLQDWRAWPEDGTKISKFGKLNRTETYQFRVPFSQLQTIRQIQAESNRIVLLISLETPPRFFRKVPEIDTHEQNARFWSQNDAWYRQTDIVYNPKHIRSSPVTLKKTKPVIDIGRWTTYRFVFDMTKNSETQLKRMFQAFCDHNIDIVYFPNFKLIADPEPAVWDYIDKPISTQSKTNSALDYLIEDAVSLAFPVRYQLEVCISQGCLNEHNLSQDFVRQLMETEVVRAQDLLEYVANRKKRMYDPMEIFNMTIVRGSASRPKIPPYCAYTRSATITPSTVYYNTPTVEISNRVVRQYAAVNGDRFLRVRFTDEKFEGRINPTDKDTSNEIFTRVKRTMINGIAIGDRHYEFLAFGNSQFREHGAYFFAPTSDQSTEGIRNWMGMFSEIVVVAKHAARLGQCFSTTRAINGTKVNIIEIDDIGRNGKTFSDGVGKISELLAQLVASELEIAHSPFGPPSVYQFRLGGCKGVLAVSPDAKKREIHLRESQYKFPAKHEGLEIIRWSQFAAANLNRQLILVLSALGVSDDIFINKLKMQLFNLERAMSDDKMALSLLQKDVDANQMTLVLASMVVDGFQSAQEPFAISLLQLWRAWSIKYLKEKARITVGDGALLFGCLDETAILKGHFNHTAQPTYDASIDERTKTLPEVFVQVSKSHDEKPQVVLGPMLLARNPSLHPGDIRVVCGVDVPELHHLRDVVVLPQTGDRDLAGMCSGGDLDGDDYLVIWDIELLPYEWNLEPMDYTAPEPVEVHPEVTIDDITSFFVTYMKNDSLPRIAHAHVAFADFMDTGVKDEKCLQLAALHSMAVDYVKTGVPARMPRELTPRRWPHFMEKKHKPKEQQYISHKVLGKLYDQVERVDFVPAFTNPFDKRILGAYKLGDNILQDAAGLKREYDAAMHRIMAQHDIKTEFEVWSTFVLHHSNQSKDYKFHEEIGQLSSALKEQYRIECYRKAGSKNFESMGPFAAAMYTVTSAETDEAVKECNQIRIVDGKEQRVRKMTPESMPLMSFPWIFHDILGKIANGNRLLTGTGSDTMILVPRRTKHTPPKNFRAEHGLLDDEDTLETAEGVTHRGEILELFDNKLIDYDGDQHHGGSDAMPECIVTDSSSEKPPSIASSASVDDLVFGDSASEPTRTPKPQPQENGDTGSSSDNKGDISANDEDLLSSTESGSGEYIRVYQGNEITPGNTNVAANHSLLLNFDDVAEQPARARAAVEPEFISMNFSDMENVEEAESLALGQSEPIIGEPPNGAKRAEASAFSIGDTGLLKPARSGPQKSSKPTSSVLLPSAEGANSRQGETPSKSSDEDDGAEEVIIQMDTKSSLLDRLADLNME